MPYASFENYFICTSYKIYAQSLPKLAGHTELDLVFLREKKVEQVRHGNMKPDPKLDLSCNITFVDLTWKPNHFFCTKPKFSWSKFRNHYCGPLISTSTTTQVVGSFPSFLSLLAIAKRYPWQIDSRKHLSKHMDLQLAKKIPSCMHWSIHWTFGK